LRVPWYIYQGSISTSAYYHQSEAMPSPVGLSIPSTIAELRFSLAEKAEAFDDAKAQLGLPTILAHFDPNGASVLNTGVFDHNISEILFRCDNIFELEPFAFYSRKVLLVYKTRRSITRSHTLDKPRHTESTIHLSTCTYTARCKSWALSNQCHRIGPIEPVLNQTEGRSALASSPQWCPQWCSALPLW